MISPKKSHQLIEISETTPAKGNFKPIKLKGINTFDGSEEFKEWIKPFKLQMTTYYDNTRLVTLISNLSEKLILMLANIDFKISSNFDSLCLFLSQEFKKAEKSARESLDEVSRMQQQENEAVVTFSARLNAKIQSLKFEFPEKEQKELFLSGLEPELQKMVRSKINPSDSNIQIKEVSEQQELE